MKLYAIACAVFSALIMAGCVTTESSHKDHQHLGPQYASAVDWHTLEEGRGLALEEGKPMLVDFALPEGCERCDFLQNNVYNRKEITDKINADFIPVWIDLSKKLTPDEKALGDKFDYRNECLLLFLDKHGTLIQDPEGKKMCFVDKIEPEIFIRHLDYVRSKYIPAPDQQ